MKTYIVVVEIPHRFPAEVYETTKELIVSLAWNKSSFDSEQFDALPAGGKFDYCFDLVCGDNHAARWYDSAYDALHDAVFYPVTHQRTRVECLVEKLAGIGVVDVVDED